MTVLHLDFETYSEHDLKQGGAYPYAEHPSTEILVACYAFDDEEVQTWVPGRDGPVPARVREHIELRREVHAHNYAFERVISNGVAAKKCGFPALTIKQGRCTAAMAAAAGIPRNLGDAAEALATHRKDDAGRLTMLKLSRARKPTKNDPTTRFTRESAPEEFAVLDSYCADDVRAERALDKALPDLTPSEQEIWELVERMNDIGVLADLEAIDNVELLIEEYKRFLELACEKATRPPADPLAVEQPAGLKPSQREKIAEWIRANGWPTLLDMQAETVKALIKRDDVPDNVKHVLRIYSTYGAKAVTKFTTIREAVCADGRLRGMWLFNGAATGRLSSLIVQLHNLFRPVIDDPETAIAAFASRNLEWIKALYPDHDFMKVAASTVRGHLIAGKGKKYICLDFAGIESRKNAWLWNEEWKLQAFRDYDAGRGPGIYEVVYGQSFQVDPRSISKKDPRRQIGKVEDLSMNYEGGVGAFVTMVDTYGVNLAELTEQVYPTLPEEVLETAAWMWRKYGRATELPERIYMACDGVKQLWRRAHPNIVAGWKELRNAAELAVQFPGNTYSVANGKALFKVMENEYGHRWLCMLLPSRKRMLRYFKPEWTPPKKVVVIEERVGHFGDMVKVEVEKEIPGELHYMGIDTQTRRYMRTSTYGGKLCENLVQASSADLLRNGMLEMEAAGYPLVLTVHDENGAEVDEGFGSVEEAAALMCKEKPWFAGLPLVAEGWEGRRYRK